MSDKARWDALGYVRSLGIPDSWIGAGFVRDAVWDHLHGRPAAAPMGDIDVIWYDSERLDRELDRELEQKLVTLLPGVAWSVKNQARMHLHNGDPQYASAIDAMRRWPETATAVAVRRSTDDRLNVAAPFGLADLFDLQLVPTPTFRVNKRAMFDDRVRAKRWLSRYPLLCLGSG